MLINSLSLILILLLRDKIKNKSIKYIYFTFFITKLGFLIINLAKLPFFFDLQLFTSTSIMLSIVVLPILPIGIYLGKLLNKNYLTDYFITLAILLFSYVV